MKIQGEKLTAFDFATAGAISGFTTRFFCQPLDVIKIRFQLQTDPHDTAKYQSVVQTVKLIAQEEGVLALWKGHVPAQCLSVVFGAVQFACYQELIHEYEKYGIDHAKWTGTAMNFVAGSMAGVAAMCCASPFDVIRTRLVAQGEPKVYHGLVDCARKIYRKEGLRGFAKGLLPACCSTAPMAGLTFGFHSIFAKAWVQFFHSNVTVDPNDDVLQDGKLTQKISTLGNLCSGLLAGLCSKTLIYPLDLVKKRLQIQGLNPSRTTLKHTMVCTGTVQCLVVTFRVEGVRGLFKGLYPSLVKAGIYTAMYFTVFDHICNLISFLKR